LVLLKQLQTCHNVSEAVVVVLAVTEVSHFASKKGEGI
jgi:hypothetical protein